MNIHDLKFAYENANPAGKFFSRENMKFAGDTMANFGCYLADVKQSDGNIIKCYIVHRGRKTSKGAPSGPIARFNAETFKIEYGKII